MSRTLDDLRRLGALLPPSERVALGEAGHVLSAAAAFAIHGEPILEAVEQGAQGVYDFFHHIAVNKAEAEGKPEPVRGHPVENVPTGAVTDAPTVSAADFAALQRQNAQILDALAAIQARENERAGEPVDKPSPPVPEPSVEPVPEPAPAPAPAVETTKTTSETTSETATETGAAGEQPPTV